MNKPNIQWVLDFIHDALYCSKRFRTLNIIDEGTHECLVIEVGTPHQRYQPRTVSSSVNTSLASQALQQPAGHLAVSN